MKRILIGSTESGEGRRCRFEFAFFNGGAAYVVFFPIDNWGVVRPDGVKICSAHPTELVLRTVVRSAEGTKHMLQVSGQKTVRPAESSPGLDDKSKQ